MPQRDSVSSTDGGCLLPKVGEETNRQVDLEALFMSKIIAHLT